MMKSDLATKLKNILDNMSQEEFDSSWAEIKALNLKGPTIKSYYSKLKFNKNMEYSPARTPKQESERLKSMYCTWLNYDQTIDERWHDPSPENNKRQDLIKKNALKLSVLFVNEILKITILDQTKFYKSVLKILKKELV